MRRATGGGAGWWLWLRIGWRLSKGQRLRLVGMMVGRNITISGIPVSRHSCSGSQGTVAAPV